MSRVASNIGGIAFRFSPAHHIIALHKCTSNLHAYHISEFVFALIGLLVESRIQDNRLQ